MSSAVGGATTAGSITAGNIIGVGVYDRVVGLISKPPSQRRDVDILPVLPWLRTRNELFRSLQQNVLVDIAKECEFSRANTDDVIIKQGDRGDRFYVILRGNVSIYINNAIADSLKEEEEGEGEGEGKMNGDEKGGEEEARRVVSGEDDGHVTSRCVSTEPLNRSLFGICVHHMKDGDSFGELALINPNCIRNASILVDEPTDLLVVNRELYGRSLLAPQTAEYEARQAFVKEHPLFKAWPIQHRRQMAMSVRYKKILYDHEIVRQGDDVDHVCFLHRGQAKLVIDPTSHVQQYPQIAALELHKLNDVTNNSRIISPRFKGDEERGDCDVGSPPSSPVRTSRGHPKKGHHGTHKSLELCLVGDNDMIGDVEFVSGLKTYSQTAVTEEICHVYFLNSRNYERLVIKKHPQTAEMIQEGVRLKLLARTSRRHSTNRIPLLVTLLDKLSPLKSPETNNIRQLILQKQAPAPQHKSPTTRRKRSAVLGQRPRPVTAAAGQRPRPVTAQDVIHFRSPTSYEMTGSHTAPPNSTMTPPNSSLAPPNSTSYVPCNSTRESVEGVVGGAWEGHSLGDTFTLRPGGMISGCMFSGSRNSGGVMISRSQTTYVDSTPRPIAARSTTDLRLLSGVRHSGSPRLKSLVHASVVGGAGLGGGASVVGRVGSDDREISEGALRELERRIRMWHTLEATRDGQDEREGGGGGGQGGGAGGGSGGGREVGGVGVTRRLVSHTVSLHRLSLQRGIEPKTGKRIILRRKREDLNNNVTNEKYDENQNAENHYHRDQLLDELY